MHLRPYVSLVGFVFLYATPPVTVISSLFLNTFLTRVQTINHCYIYTCTATHDMYTHTQTLFMVTVCFHYLFASKRNAGMSSFFMRLSLVLLSL